MAKVTLKVAKSKFLAWVKTARAQATHEFYRHFLERALKHFGNIPLAELSPARVLEWSQQFHSVISLQRCLSWCHKDARLIKVNPLEGMGKPKVGQRQRVLSKAEQAHLLRSSKGPFRRFLLFLRETLCRPQEARKLAWNDLRGTLEMGFTASGLRSGVPFFNLAKFKGRELRGDGRRSRVIPVSPRLGRLLARLWGQGQEMGQPILLNALGRQWTTNAVRCRMRALRNRVDLVTDEAGEKIVAYHMRHSGATEAAAAGVRDFLLAELLGHASTKTTARYVHLQPEHLQEALGRIRGPRKRRSIDF